MKTEIITITPELAQLWLGKNQGNRSLSDAVIRQYANDMKNGNWQTTNQGIGFFDDGRLADGQHRLHAIIKSGVSVPMLVVYGLKAEAVDGIDINRTRSLADIMTLKNGTVSPNEVAILRLAYDCQAKVSPAQMQLMIEKSLERLRIIADLFNGVNPSIRKTTLFAGLLIAHNAGLTFDEINRFTQVLRTGIFDTDGEQSVFLLRDKILQGEFSTHSGSAARTRKLKQILYIIQKFRQNKAVKRLSIIEPYIYPPLKI